MKLNKNKSSSLNGVRVSTTDPSEEILDLKKHALFNQEMDPIDIMRGGKSYFVKGSNLMRRSFLEFPGQLVLHTCSPGDEIEIRIVWDLAPI
jgi:hypothetical protein